MMLANAFGVTNDGQQVIIGPGWMVRPPTQTPTAVAFVAHVPRDDVGPHQIRLELLDSEGHIVVVDPPDGPGPMIFEEEFQPIGLNDPKLTTPISVAGGINLPPVPLDRGSDYHWRAYVDGETRESWSLPFRTSPPKAPPRRKTGQQRVR